MVNHKLPMGDQVPPNDAPDQDGRSDKNSDRRAVRGRSLSIDGLDWNVVQTFLTVSDAQSFKTAARWTGRSVNTVRTHIDQLEHRIGAPLFRRSYRGAKLTAVGRDFYAQIKLMRPSADDKNGPKTRSSSPDEIGLVVTEGLGTFWIIPRISEFKAAEPNLRIRIDCTMAKADLSHRDVDIAVQLERPDDPDLICVKLGTLHLMPFASLDYAAVNGLPRSIDEAFSHRFVIQIAEQVRSDIFSMFAGSNPPPGLIAMETNSSSAHYWAVANNVGIGILPTYARALTRKIIPINMELKLRRDIWLIYHPDIRRSKVHMRAVDWLRQAFDAEQYPWFGEPFVHPDNFETRFSEDNIVSLFAGFTDLEM